MTFYYGGTVPLTGTDPKVLAAHLGRPAIVAVTPLGNEARGVEAVHSIGAKAYRYIQFYWGPNDEDYEGLNLKAHPDWAFCSSGSTPSLGRTTDGGAKKWYFIDTNESAVRARIAQILAGFKADGWDGVMFDRGEAATQYAKDANGRPVWSRQSTCTRSPYKSGARFADAYVSMVGLAHKAGLQVMMNNGKSPFDPVTPMRPNPADSNCQNANWTKCTYLSDAWPNIDLVLNETAGRPKDELWDRTFVANMRSEQDAAHGKRTVGLITTATLGGKINQTRSRVFYQWSRIKLFDLAVAVNTGDDNCASASDKDAVCNRYGVYPDLVNMRFGSPLAKAPLTQGCVSGSKVNCVWVRRYAKGVNVVNVSSQLRSSELVQLGTATCRYVYNVYERKPMAGNLCVKNVRVNLSAWSGRPLKYSTQPW
ncbi:MAG: hypothetical protein ABIR57_01975 [Aeromicrobium sp.]